VTLPDGRLSSPFELLWLVFERLHVQSKHVAVFRNLSSHLFSKQRTYGRGPKIFFIRQRWKGSDYRKQSTYGQGGEGFAFERKVRREFGNDFVAKLERSLISERVRAGLRNARAKGKRLGRPPVAVDAARIASLRASGQSWPQIARELGVSVGKVYQASNGGTLGRHSA